MDRAELQTPSPRLLGGKAVWTGMAARKADRAGGVPAYGCGRHLTTSNYQENAVPGHRQLSTFWSSHPGGFHRYGLARMFTQQSRDGQPMKLKELFQGFREGFQGPAFAEPDAESFIVL